MKLLLEENDISMLKTDSMLKFVAMCVETMKKLITEKDNYFSHLNGQIPSVIDEAIRVTINKPISKQDLMCARLKCKDAANWIKRKEETDDRHEDSRYEDTAPDEDYAYISRGSICEASVLMIDVALALIKNELPLKSTLKCLRGVERATNDFALSQYYWDDDARRVISRVTGEVDEEIRSHYAAFAAKNTANMNQLLETELPNQQLIELIQNVNIELIMYLKQHPDEIYKIRPRL